MRQAQAVVLQQDYGLSLEQTAHINLVARGLGQSAAQSVPGWRDGGRWPGTAARGPWRQIITPRKNARFWPLILDRASTGGILAVGQIKEQIDTQLGRPIAPPSVYKLLHGHGWRKLAPDKRYPQSDPRRRRRGKKLPAHLPLSQRALSRARPPD